MFFQLIFFVGCFKIGIMKTTVREPKQERSIEKKNKIIQAGYELFSEKGYYGTNTVEIAKRAGVSTGIVYGYFQDKRDILICVLQIYIDKVSEPLLSIIDSVTAPTDYPSLVLRMVDTTIKLHKENVHLHNTLHSLAGSDEDVNAAFISLEDNLTHKIADRLNLLGANIPDCIEKVHLAMNIVQSFAHEFVYDKHKYIDYTAMKAIVCDTVTKLFVG